MNSAQKADAVLEVIEQRSLNSATGLTMDQSIALAQVYATRALTEPADSSGLAEFDAFLAGIDPKELERVVLERDDLHDGLTGPMLQQLRDWLAGR